MITAQAAAQTPLETDAAITERADSLVGRACRRQLWLMFLDAEGRQLPMLVPVEDYPASPHGFAALFASSVRDMMTAMDAAHVIAVWERRLGEASAPAEREWARELARACSEAGVSLRAQLISHRSGVRWFGAEEYAE